MWVVGLTGGIGAGKSQAQCIFEQCGITVVDADAIARQVVEPGSEVLEKIKQRFGSSILYPDGTLDRKTLRAIIFSNVQDKLWLNQTMHPVIRVQLLQAIEAATSPYCVASVPLLIENGMEGLFNRILVIESTKEHRLQRICARDNCSIEQAQQIIDSQASHEHRRQVANDIIENDGSLEDFKASILKLHQQYLKLATLNA